MPVNPARLDRDFRTIADCTGSPGQGASRPTFSPQWADAVSYVAREAEACGCQLRRDAAGNVYLRPREWAVPTDSSDRPSRAVWLSGSHLDSVPFGGDYDGVLGVVAPLEVLRAAREDGRSVPLELVIFAEEEGTTFGLGMIGSRLITGSLAVGRLTELHNDQGLNYLEAGQPFGVRPEHLAAEQFEPQRYRGLIELHIEQGPAMWNRGEAVAVVTAINGRRQYKVSLCGTANHAGSTPMGMRRDALAAAAEMIAAVEAFAPRLAPQAVATVGRIECRPNAVNVIADRVDFLVDFRAPADELLTQGDHQLHRTWMEIAHRRGLELSVDANEVLPAAAMAPEVCRRLHQAARQVLSVEVPNTVSGALHDSAILAPHLPTAMFFVASRDGISHNPAEFSRLEDMTLATRILYQAVLETDAR